MHWLKLDWSREIGIGGALGDISGWVVPADSKKNIIFTKTVNKNERKASKRRGFSERLLEKIGSQQTGLS